MLKKIFAALFFIIVGIVFIYGASTVNYFSCDANDKCYLSNYNLFTKKYLSKSRQEIYGKKLACYPVKRTNSSVIQPMKQSQFANAQYGLFAGSNNFYGKSLITFENRMDCLKAETRFQERLDKKGGFILEVDNNWWLRVVALVVGVVVLLLGLVTPFCSKTEDEMTDEQRKQAELKAAEMKAQAEAFVKSGQAKQLYDKVENVYDKISDNIIVKLIRMFMK